MNEDSRNNTDLQQDEHESPSAAPAPFRGAKGDARFVIFTHDHPFLHWDLMLEEGEALTTFRLLAEPGLGVVTDAEALPPHRMAYLDYEGPVSGGRGTVQRWDHGTYRLLSSSPAEKVVQLTGARLQATLALSDKSGKWFCDVKSP